MQDVLFWVFMFGLIHKWRLLPKGKLRRSYCFIALGLLLTSCVTYPKETYLTKANLSGIQRVAIVALANVPDVTYSSGDVPTSLILFPIIGILPAIIEASAKSAIDTEHTQQIGKQFDLTKIEDKITEVFSKSILPTGCFITLEQIKNNNQNEQLLSKSGYDAIIRLTVREISLDKTKGDDVSLHLHVQGQLQDLKSRKILWDRDEIATSPESHKLDYYKTNILKEVNSLLEKAGRRLAYDFIYLK